MDLKSLKESKCCGSCEFFGSIDGEYGYCKEIKEQGNPDCYSELVCDNWKGEI